MYQLYKYVEESTEECSVKISSFITQSTSKFTRSFMRLISKDFLEIQHPGLIMFDIFIKIHQPGKLLKALLAVETRLRYFRMNIQGLYEVQAVRHSKSLQIRLIVVRTSERLVTSALVFG